MNGIIIFWHLIFALVGGLIGVLIGRSLERRSSRAIKAPAPAAVPAAAIDPGLLRAGRTSTGKIWFEMNGKHIGDRTELDPDSRQALLDLVVELRPWLDLEKIIPPAPVAAAAQPAAPVAPVAPVAPKKVEKPEPPAAPPMKSIIEQVNDVLQAKLEASAMRERGIQLIEGANGSVIVQDGLHRYEGLEAVPDGEVTTLIRSAIAEWEKSAK